MFLNPILLLAAGLTLATALWGIWYGRYVTRQMPPAGEFLETPGGRLHYIRRGTPSDLPPIVVIHGSTTNVLDMELEIGPRLADAGRDVIMLDRPGHGFSDRWADGWRLDTQARAVRALVEALDLPDPIVLGQSFGGAIALRYALDHADRLAALVLIAPVSHRWPGGVAWYNRVALNPRYGWLFRHTFMALYGRYGSIRGAYQALKGSKHQSSYHARTRVRLTFRPQAFRHNAEDIVRLYEQLVGMDTRYHEIEVPTEIVAGTHDMTVITSVHGRNLERQIPGASLAVIDHGGHALHHTHPDETIAAVERIDQRLASAGRSPLKGALQRLSQVLPGGGDSARPPKN